MPRTMRSGSTTRSSRSSARAPSPKPKALSKDAFFIGAKAHDKDDRIIATKTKKGYDLFYDADGLGGKAHMKFGSIEFDKLDKKKHLLTAADFFVI